MKRPKARPRSHRRALRDWTFFPHNPFRFPSVNRSGLSPYALHLYEHSWSQGTELAVGRRIARGLLQLLSPRGVALGKRRNTHLMLRRMSMKELSSEVNSERIL